MDEARKDEAQKDGVQEPKPGKSKSGKTGADAPKADGAKAGASVSGPETTAKKPDFRTAAVEALMRLAAEQPWNDIEIGDIAREADLSLGELRELFPSKGAVLGGLSRIIDRACSTC
jgi:hypothetical protein